MPALTKKKHGTYFMLEIVFFLALIAILCAAGAAGLSGSNIQSVRVSESYAEADALVRGLRTWGKGHQQFYADVYHARADNKRQYPKLPKYPTNQSELSDLQKQGYVSAKTHLLYVEDVNAVPSEAQLDQFHDNDPVFLYHYDHDSNVYTIRIVLNKELLPKTYNNEYEDISKVKDS